MPPKKEYSLPKFHINEKANYIKLEENLDIFKVFENIEKDCKHCFFFESLEVGGQNARFDVIGFEPEILITVKQNKIFWENQNNNENIEIETSNPYKTIAEWFPQNIISRNYAGGLVGYLGYDASNYFEPTLHLRTHPHFPQMLFGVYTDGLIHDKYTGEITYFYYEKNRISQVSEWFNKESSAKENLKIKHIGSSCSAKQHALMLERVKDEILKGNTFQCQIGFQENYDISGELISFYKKLRQINPSPYMFYMKCDSRILIGSSPELIFRLQQKEIETYPLAGTIKRGIDIAQDLELARTLLNDAKEIAEHNMLVDLHRNDIGRIARFGSVRVRRLMDTKKFSHVQHISSEVVALLNKKYDMFDGLASVFPAGTLTGAPKIESMKIIEAIEHEFGSGPRGPYGGAVGSFGFNGDCTFAIPIRSLFIYKNQAFTRSSSGIVYDSTHEGEFNEIKNKLVAIHNTLKTFLY